MEPTVQNRLHSIKLWPPSQSTRQVLLDRIIKNLTTPSILSRKYGLLSKEEAEEDAKRIESAAFATANQHFEKEPDGDGGSAVQLYAKESSTLMVVAVKRGPRVKEEQESKESSTLMVETAEHGPKAMEEEEVEEAGFETEKFEEETIFDISAGVRAFIEAEEAEALLKPLKEPGNKYTTICLSNRSFGLGAARVAVPILFSLKGQLTEVNLSDFVAGRPEEEALEVMGMFSSALEGSELKSLNLSHNALGEKGVRAFGDLLKSQSNLEELYLINDGISEDAANAVCELIPSTENLKILHFHNNMTGDEGAIHIAQILKNSPILEDFKCSSSRVDSDGGIALAEALATCTHIKKLDLRDNMFGVEAGIALSKTIPVFTNLTEIYLGDLNLENEGAEALAKSLENAAPLLEVLDFSGNEIDAEAAPALAACVIAKKATLTKINFAENELKDAGAMVIAKALEEDFPRLTEVDLSTNMIRRAGARVLALAVIGKAGFKSLNIDSNFISEEGVEELKEIFRHSSDILRSLGENDPSGEEYEEDDVEGDDDVDGELESKLKDLEIKQDE